MTTSLTEMLELPNLITWPHLHYNVMDRNHDVITVFSKKLYFKKSGVAIFAEIIKIVTMYIKTILKDSRKVKKN